MALTGLIKRGKGRPKGSKNKAKEYNREIVDQVEHYYKPPWNVDKMVDRSRFEVRTKKEYLSKTGKEGNNVLLHDAAKKK
ncbi:unnamed protein product [Sphagnum balticum]